jgi:tetratricopeptide (TPR) repeat protein
MAFSRFLALALALAGILVATAPSPAETPIPNGPESCTQVKFLHALHTARMRRFQAYEKHTADSAEVRVAAMKFLSDFDEAWVAVPRHRTWAEVAAAGSAVVKQGSRDPLIALFEVRARNLAVPGSVDYERELWKCYDALAATSYPTLLKLEPLCQLFAGWTKRVPKGKPGSKELVQQFADAWIRDPAATEADRRMRWDWVRPMFDDFDIEHKTIFNDACAAYTEADPWLYNFVAGSYHIDLGWHFRGGGYAHTVTEAGAWKFQENLRIAGGHLTTAWQIDPKLPEPAAESITTAMAGEQATASSRAWFDRAVAAQMDYEPAYEKYIWSLRPRWGGSFEQLYAFGKECLATKRFDTSVPHQMVDIVYHIDDDIDEGHFTAFQNETLWADVNDIFVQTLAEFDREANYNDSAAMATQWLLYAIHGNHFDDAVKALQVIDDHSWKLNPRQLNFLRLREQSARAMAQAFGGPAAEAARAAVPFLLPMKRLEGETLAGVLAALEAVVAADDREAVQAYFRHWRQTLSWEKAYDAGDWVTLSFDAKMTGWMKRFGEWQPQDDGTVVARLPPKFTYVEAFCNARFPGAYEVRVDVSLPEGSKKPVAPCVVAFVELQQWNVDPTEVRRFWVAPFLGRAGITDGQANHFGRQVAISLTGPNEIAAQVWPNDYVFEINGCNVQIAKPTPEMARDRIAIGSAYHVDPKALIHFHRVRVRKLTRNPPPPEQDYKARLAYYNEILADDPENLTGLWNRAMAQMGLGEYAAAQVDLDRALAREPGIAFLHLYRGFLAERQGDYARALAEQETSVKLDRDVLASWRRIAWIRATCSDPQFRDGAKAVEAGKRACEIMKYRDVDSLLGLSAAYAEAGDHDQAIAMAKKALPLAPKERKQETREFLERREARMPETDRSPKPTPVKR